jgi:hypothetical protein
MDTETAVPAATHLLYRHHADPDEQNDYATDDGECCFCGVEAAGLPASDAINHTYFSDYDIMQADTGHVCEACAYCMDTRALKNGHWIASANEFASISTGGLPPHFDRLRNGEYETPVAVHLSANPIRSEHAYLWTPVVHEVAPLTLDYDNQTVELSWDEYDRVLEAVEELRWHGFRGDDIRSGEPRIRDLRSVGRDRYQTLNARLDPYRNTPLLEVVWTLSRSKTDQSEPPESASTNT